MLLRAAAEPGLWNSPCCSYVIVHVQSHLYLDILKVCSEESPVITLLSQITYRTYVYVAICCKIRCTGSPFVHFVELFCCLDFFLICIVFARVWTSSLYESLDIILKIDHSREFIFQHLEQRTYWDDNCTLWHVLCSWLS